MKTTIIIVAGLMCGLYAGKRRERGAKWTEIAKEAAAGTKSLICKVWEKASYPFKRTTKNDKVIDATIEG